MVRPLPTYPHRLSLLPRPPLSPVSGASPRAELLPVPYFHVVFRLPEQIAAIAFYNKEVVYHILYRTVAETLLTIGVRFSSQPGFISLRPEPRPASGTLVPRQADETYISHTFR